LTKLRWFSRRRYGMRDGSTVSERNSIQQFNFRTGGGSRGGVFNLIPSGRVNEQGNLISEQVSLVNNPCSKDHTELSITAGGGSRGGGSAKLKLSVSPCLNGALSLGKSALLPLTYFSLNKLKFHASMLITCGTYGSMIYRRINNYYTASQWRLVR
jgi:hypothetical protein